MPLGDLMKIKGITIDLGVNTKPVTEGFRKVNTSLNETNRALRDIDKGLKFDPKNAELLSQKVKYLNKAIEETTKKLDEEQKILDALKEKDGGTGKYAQQMDAVKREIEATKQKQDQYKQSLKDVTEQTEKASKENEELSNSFFNASVKSELFIKGAELAGEAVKKLIGFIADAIKASSEFADTILTESTVTGLSTDALQEYYYMAELVDVSVGTITGSLSKLTKQMYSAKDGTGSAAEYFDALGVSVVDADGNLRDNNEVFDEIIDKLGQVSNDTERDAIAMGIFGKSAQELNPLIAQGSDNLQAFRDEAHQMGYVLDGEALSSLGAVDDAFQRSSLFIDSIKNQIGEGLAPVIVDIAEKFTAWAQSVDWNMLGQIIGEFINAIVVFIQGAAITIGIIIDSVKFTFQVLWDFCQSLWDFFSQMWEGIVQTVQDAKDALQPIIDGIVGFFQSVWDVVDKVVGKVGDFIGAISGAISKAGEFMSGGFGKVASFFGFGGGGFGSGGFATPSFASGGYNLSTSVTINNYSTPVTGAFADRVATIVNEKLGRMIR